MKRHAFGIPNRMAFFVMATRKKHVFWMHLILCIVTFIFTFLFKTDIMGFVYVCIILLVNNVSYMMRAAKLERRR